MTKQISAAIAIFCIFATVPAIIIFRIAQDKVLLDSEISNYKLGQRLLSVNDSHCITLIGHGGVLVVGADKRFHLSDRQELNKHWFAHDVWTVSREDNNTTAIMHEMMIDRDYTKNKKRTEYDD